MMEMGKIGIRKENQRYQDQMDMCLLRDRKRVNETRTIITAEVPTQGLYVAN